MHNKYKICYFFRIKIKIFTFSPSKYLLMQSLYNSIELLMETKNDRILIKLLKIIINNLLSNNSISALIHSISVLCSNQIYVE